MSLGQKTSGGKAMEEAKGMNGKKSKAVGKYRQHALDGFIFSLILDILHYNATNHPKANGRRTKSRLVKFFRKVIIIVGQKSPLIFIIRH